MSEYKITTTDTQEAELTFLAGTDATIEETLQAIVDQKLVDLYSTFRAHQETDFVRKLDKIAPEDKADLDAAIAKVDERERAEKEAEAQARLNESLGEGKP
jgi:hypothetical protein